MLHKCTCHSPYQDKQYGKGIRVFNYKGKSKEGKTKGMARCTVCGYILQSTVGYVATERPEGDEREL